MERHFGIAQDVSGNVIPSATIRVRLAGTGTDAIIYSDGAYTPLANPFTSETDGVYQFYARDGRYDVVLTKTGFTFDDDDTADILLEDGASVISPAQIIADQNDYAPTNGVAASIWRLTSDAARSITGITAGNSGQRLTILNVGSFALTFVNDSGLSTAANRILTGSGSDLTIASDGVIRLVYDASASRWRTTGSVAGSVVSTTTVSMSPGTITGLTLSNGADANNDINIAVGAASSDDAALDDKTTLYLQSVLTKRLDANWAVGTNQGGLDTGAIANTTYHIFLIKRTDTGVVDALFSASATAPSMPASYDKKVRIGSVIRSGGALLLFTQYDKRFVLTSMVTDVSATNPGTAAVTRTLTVPTGIVVLANLLVGVANTTPTVAVNVLISPLITGDVAPASGTSQVSASASDNRGSSEVSCITNTSAQVRSRISESDADITLNISTIGWVDVLLGSS